MYDIKGWISQQNEFVQTEFFIIAAFILVVVIVSLILVIRLLVKKRNEECLNIVIETSERYKALEAQNSTYDFHENLRPSYLRRWTVNSKQQLDRFNFEQRFTDEIANNLGMYKNQLLQVTENFALNRKYQNDLKHLPEFATPESEFVSGMRFRKYSKIEEKVCTDAILEPVIDIRYACSVTYTSPKGRNHYKREYLFYSSNVKHLIDNIEKTENYKASKEYQRGLMTDSLRYDILKRDGFKCVICGRTASDGVKLHVDHIKPIARGGKTIANNLRTLCDQCNQGKSDKWDEDGLN